jgi:outer membrane protein assembly factor BamB
VGVRSPRPDPGCDWDFGATPNFRPGFLGVGGKDGTYYSLDPKTGELRWKQNVVAGGSAGGFIGTTALDGQHVYGATAIGKLSGPPCDPSNPNDTEIQEPSMHAFNASTGDVLWQQEGAQSVSATTVAGGMTFTCTAFSQQLQIRNASDGSPVAIIPVPSGCNSGVVVAGNFVIIGEGEAENGDHSGVELFTLNGAPQPL